MATVNFLYRSTKQQSPLSLRLLFRHGVNDEGKPIDHSFAIKIRLIVSKQYWEKQHKLKRTRDIETSNKQTEINTELNKIENYVLNAFNAIAPNNVSKEWLQNVVDNYYNPPRKEDVPDTLIEYFDYYLQINKHIKEGTRRKIRVVKHRIENRLQELNHNRPILMSDIDDYFKERFYNLFDDYALNTIEYTLKEIKTLCLHAHRKGISIHKDILSWKMKTEPNPIIYLAKEEIETIKNAGILSDYLDNARDWLIISCYTGQRVSDFMRFEKSMLRIQKNAHGKEITLIEFAQIKTGAMIALPLHAEVIKILDKRNGEFPRAISDVKYNCYIKEVCEKAGIMQPVRGSKKIQTEPESKKYRKQTGIFPKHELITSHIGRRSFATNNFGNIPTPLIMSATGHTKESMFLAYIGKTQTEQAMQLADYF